MLRFQLFLLTLIPIAFLCLTISILTFWGTRDLTAALSAQVETRLLADRREALRAYATIAQSAIAPYVRAGENVADQQARAQEILAAMAFGQDGYFYVYDYSGTNLVHPRLTHLQGQDLWNMQDPQGDLVIQSLIAAAQGGGGFHSYIWNKPSTNQDTPKLGYAVGIDEWGWMVGTGHYLDDLEQESAALQATINETVGRALTWLLVFGLIAIGVAGLIVFAFQVRLQQRANRELQGLNKRIVDIQEIQAKRISQDLHDGVSQSLVLASYSIEAAEAELDKGQAPALLTRARRSLDQALAELRQVSKALRPPALDQLGLSEALQALAEDFRTQSNLIVHATSRSFGDHLSDFSKIALFRVAQEALTNVAKHAQASEVAVSLYEEAGQAHLVVTDNGRGLSPAEQADALEGGLDRGFGLQNMAERLQSLGGRLTISSAKEGGTRIAGWVPLEVA